MLGFGPLGAHALGEGPDLTRLLVTSRQILKDPVDYVLAAQQYLDESANHSSFAPGQAKQRFRLRGPAPSFTVRTSKKGYD